MEFREKLKRLCHDRRMSQVDLAAAIGSASKSSVTNWMNGTSKPGIDTALQIARALEVTLDWLADDEADYPPPSRVRPQADIDQTVIFEMAKVLGIEEAKRRLMQA